VIVLFTNIGLSRRTGTEVFIADLARALKAQGHQPVVYSPSAGPVADEIRAGNILVETDLSRLPAPDVIHGHHHLETIQALQRFPRVPALFVCHDLYSWHDQVPRHPNIRRFVAVGLNARQRLIRDWPRTFGRIEVIGNGVDTARFVARPALPPVPGRALVFSNDVGDDSHWEPILEACTRLGIPVERVGAACGRQVAAPEAILGNYDLVFAKGRCALEAAATGAAVILCDLQGLGSMITSQDVRNLEVWNFGMRTLSRPINPDLIVREIQRYDAGDAARVKDFIRTYRSLSETTARYLNVYQRIRAEGVPSGFWNRWRTFYPETRRLQAADQPGLEIEIQDCPETVRAGAWFELRVLLRSRIDVPVATSPPYPTLFFHRWHEDGREQAMPVETPRGLIQPPLYPGKTGNFTIRAIAPRKPGRFRLRVTLMQEGWRWLDAVDPRVFADCWIRASSAH
jgi:glycosyltransferase involved in cell wall biosynthesis